MLKKKDDSDKAFMEAETLLGSSGLDQEKIDKVKETISEAKLKIYQNEESDKFVHKEREPIEKVENPNASMPELRYAQSYKNNNQTQFSLIMTNVQTSTE